LSTALRGKMRFAGYPDDPISFRNILLDIAKLLIYVVGDLIFEYLKTLFPDGSSSLQITLMKMMGDFILLAYLFIALVHAIDDILKALRESHLSCIIARCVQLFTTLIKSWLKRWRGANNGAHVPRTS
jgi:hypothetical protein